MKNLFLTGFVQVFLVAVNTWLISRSAYVGVFVVSTLISFVWSWNVKKIAFWRMRERLAYALGAGVGATCGLALAELIGKEVLK